MWFSVPAAISVRGACTAETPDGASYRMPAGQCRVLQQALIKLARETQGKITAADRDLPAARAELLIVCTSAIGRILLQK